MDDSDFAPPAEEPVTLAPVPSQQSGGWLSGLFQGGPKKKKKKKKVRREREPSEGPGVFGKICTVIFIILMVIRCITAVFIMSRFGPEPWAIVGLAVGVIGIGIGIGYMNGSLSSAAVNVAMLVLGVMCGLSNIQSTRLMQ